MRTSPTVVGTTETSMYARVEQILGTKALRIQGPIDLHERIVKGLPQRTMVTLVKGFRLIKQEESFRALNLSSRTWHRIKADKQQSLPMNSDQSARVWNMAEVLSKAEDVFGGRNEAEQWLSAPATGLNSRRPIELMASPQGAELVKTFLDQMAYGVYV